MTSVPGHEPGGAQADEQLLQGALGGDSAAATALGILPVTAPAPSRLSVPPMGDETMAKSAATFSVSTNSCP